MAELKVLNLPTEVQLALEVMPCQANRRIYEPAETPHPCAYFADWGVYHSFDYASAGPPPEKGIQQPSRYMGKTYLLPEILSGCRKAPIMCVGINPNLPGYWPKTHNAVNPLFNDYLQYAHYFRYRSVSKLQIPRENYDEMLGGRQDTPNDPQNLTTLGAEIPVEQAALTMYKAYQSLLDGLGDKHGWANHKLAVGEDLSYANMVACPSAKWVVDKKDPQNPEMPVMGTERMWGIVGECWHERRYFLRQLFQSLPVVVMVFSQTTSHAFITAMAGKFMERDQQTGELVKKDPQPTEKISELLKREIWLRYGTTSDGINLDARIIFSPHASAKPAEFEKFKATMIGILSEEVDAGRLVFNEQTGHLARPRGGCVFCTNALYRIGPCDYEKELRPLATKDATAIGGQVASLASDEPVPIDSGAENDEQARLLENFLGAAAFRGRVGPTPSGAALIEAATIAEAEQAEVLNIDALTSPPVVLRGRIVTMNDNSDVIEDGYLYISEGKIVAATGPDTEAPEGFSTAPVIETGGTIYPGLLDLHNHLAYNITTLWKVPRKFSNRSQWQRHQGYAENVKMPLDVLTRDSKTSKAIVRYVEVKSLLGGTTSVQGMRSKFSSLPVSRYAGVVRNFERTDDDRLPAASGRIPDLNVKKQDQIDSFRTALNKYNAYFYHLSEGVDANARAQYLNLVEQDLIAKALVAIHALALEPGDLANISKAGGKVVWSPMSNLLLYGATINAKKLLDSGVPFALGCDWSPSGSKNLLEEMKVAWLSAQADGADISYEALCRAVTRDAATIVGWGDALGTIEDDKYADLMIVSGNTGDPYENLVRATERDVQMVVVQGYARYGDEDVMTQFGYPKNRLESLVVGGKNKRLYLSQEGDPLKTTSFAGALATLSDSMSRLRELQIQVTSAAFELSSDEETFQLELDNEDFGEDEWMDAELAASAELPESIDLDVPTVIDDEGYFERLEEIKHLPDALRKLRDFYTT
jgi:cytosine/adenosine deaminase-related metal-dependent hydrolase